MADGGRVLVIDSQVAGVSGDMMLGALVDLGASSVKISEALQVAQRNLRGCSKLQIEVSQVVRKGIRAKKVNVRFEEEISERHAIEIEEAIVKTCASIGLSEKAKGFALNTVRTLIEAEAKIHGEAVSKIHFHELGSADSVADIIGSAVALEDLDIFKDTVVYATPVAVGSGLLRFSHGTVPIPAPATLEILSMKKFPMTNQTVSGELATPTGVALLVNLADKITGVYPPMRPTAVGYGAGSKEFAEMANVLRVTLGEPVHNELLTDKVYIIETNLDDVPGEIIGYTVDKVLKEGARDICIIPIFGKKNRPGQILQIITDEDKVARLAQLLMEETGTLGVRFFPCQRYILDRESLPMGVITEEIKGRVNVKVSRTRGGKVLQVKPEYEEVKALAEKSGKPLREIMRLMQREAWDILAREGQENPRKP